MSRKITSKQRSILMGMASKLEPILAVGKEGPSPEFTKAVREALDARELVKINILKSFADDKKELALTIANRTDAEVVTVIGRKIVLFKYQKNPLKRKIEL